MAISFSALRKPVNRQVVDPSTGLMREEWDLYLDGLTKRLNAAVDDLATAYGPADAEYVTASANASLTAERVVTDTATVTKDTAAAGQIKLNVPDDAITYAKLQNVSATSRILGRKTSGAGNTEECTLSEALDFIGSAAQGDLLYRGASAWARLAAGTSGQRLATGGTGANPAWGGGITTIASGSVGVGTTLDITNIPSHYSYLYLSGASISSDTAARTLQVQASSDNGSTYDTTSGNYNGLIFQAAAAVAAFSTASIIQAGANTLAADTAFFNALIFNYQSGGNKVILANSSTTGGGTRWTICQWFGGDGTALDALRLLWSGSGNFDGGTYALQGIF